VLGQGGLWHSGCVTGDPVGELPVLFLLQMSTAPDTALHCVSCCCGLQFLECLFVHYDFDGAQQKLQECDAVIDNDYFLTAIKADFLESARLFVFETYCRIHQVGVSGEGYDKGYDNSVRIWGLQVGAWCACRLA
jgi:hypothetical protein